MPFDKNINFSDNFTKTRIEDITFASPIGFRLFIDSQRYPNAQFTVQTAAIPEISVDAAPFITPQRNIGVAGDKVEYAPFECSFLIDEKLENYKEIHEWLLGLAVEPESRDIRKTRDLALLILDSHNNVSREIHFVDAYPTSLSTLDFDAKSTDVQYLVGQITFEYSYFEIK
jgi:hypothetical protein